MTDNQYTYAVARIRSRELSLFSKAVLEQLLACKSYEECIRLLTEKGWGKSSEETAEELLAEEREKTWELIGSLVEDMSVFNVFLYGNDYHNLKAAIKQVYRNTEFPNIYISHGTIAPETIYKAAKEHDFSLLPEYMRDCAEEAYQVQLRTGDGQLCDIIIDRASLKAIYEKAAESRNELFMGYAELKIAAANINIAIRGHKTGKGIEFFRRAMAECSSLDISKLTSCALSSMEDIYEYLENTVYSDAVQAIKKSPSEFERWCDDVIMEHIRPQKSNPFTVSPLAAYILAREGEIKSVRILLSGKLNDLSEDSIRERLRLTYV